MTIVGSVRRFLQKKYFEKYSGLKLNVEKMEAMWFGSDRGKSRKPLGIKWPNEPIKSLGVSFTYNKFLSQKQNFDKKITALKSMLNLWNMRNLTIIGRILIVKTLGISKFVYLASLIPFPKDKIVVQIYTFVWKGKRGKIKRKTLSSEIEEGGLKMPDLSSKIKAMQVIWVKR